MTDKNASATYWALTNLKILKMPRRIQPYAGTHEDNQKGRTFRGEGMLDTFHPPTSIEWN
jgi:hypothetical protein